MGSPVHPCLNQWCLDVHFSQEGAKNKPSSWSIIIKSWDTGKHIYRSPSRSLTTSNLWNSELKPSDGTPDYLKTCMMASMRSSKYGIGIANICWYFRNLNASNLRCSVNMNCIFLFRHICLKEWFLTFIFTISTDKNRFGTTRIFI